MTSATIPGVTTRVAAAAFGIKPRLAVLREARLRLAAGARELVDAMPAELARTRADSLAAEVLPSARGLPFSGAGSSTDSGAAAAGAARAFPSGLRAWKAAWSGCRWVVVLVIGASNYPLFLAGVQTLQALAAGNSRGVEAGARGQRRWRGCLRACWTKPGCRLGCCRLRTTASKRELRRFRPASGQDGLYGVGRGGTRGSDGGGEKRHADGGGAFRLRCRVGFAECGCGARGGGAVLRDAAERVCDVHGATAADAGRGRT